MSLSYLQELRNRLFRALPKYEDMPSEQASFIDELIVDIKQVTPIKEIELSKEELANISRCISLPLSELHTLRSDILKELKSKFSKSRAFSKQLIEDLQLFLKNPAAIELPEEKAPTVTMDTTEDVSKKRKARPEATNTDNAEAETEEKPSKRRIIPSRCDSKTGLSKPTAVAVRPFSPPSPLTPTPPQRSNSQAAELFRHNSVFKSEKKKDKDDEQSQSPTFTRAPSFLNKRTGSGSQNDTAGCGGHGQTPSPMFS